VRSTLGLRAQPAIPGPEHGRVPVTDAADFALVAPLILTATVVLSFAAAPGISAFFLNHVSASATPTHRSRCSCLCSWSHSASTTTSS
jgi:hypothetical protein